MTPAPSLPADVWDALPASARVFFESMRSRIESLQAEVATLKARLDLNSSNSSKPPSSDPPHVQRQPPRPTSKRKRGGQPGHKRAVRPMVPPEQLTGGVDCAPGVRSCGACLTGTDPAPHPHQVAELPRIRPDVIEYRLHRLVCPQCHKATRVALPPGVPAGAFGPRLLATIALLRGRYRLGKRPVQAILADLMGLSIPTGMVSEAEQQADTATTAPAAEVAGAIAASPALNVDGTGWRQARKRAWRWTAAAPTMALFRIDRSRSVAALRRLVGEAITPTITSDRFSTYKKVPNRRVCWAHLRRDFQAMIDRAAGGQEVGAKLLALSGRVFDEWRKSSAGAIRRTTSRGTVGWMRSVVRLNLEAGRDGPCPWTAKVCRELLKIEASLWTFARVQGVTPDNNAAERALRHGVIWRKISGGTDSERGGRFVGQILSVVATCRQRGRDVLSYLTECFGALIEGRPAPSLIR